MSSFPFPVWEIHPALVHFPIALIYAAVAVDIWAAWKDRAELYPTSTGILGWGAIAMAVAGAFGFLAFFTVRSHTEDAHVGMWWHLVVNSLSLILIGAVAAARWRARAVQPTVALRALTLAGALVMGFGAYMGGDIVYHGGAGVDPEILAPEIQHHTHGGAAGPGGHEHHHDHAH